VSPDVFCARAVEWLAATMASPIAQQRERW